MYYLFNPYGYIFNIFILSSFSAENFTFLIPLIAATVLLSLAILIFKNLIKTRLITLLILEAIPLGFGIWMLDRTINAASMHYVDLFRLSNLCYILGPMFLVFFVDLISRGDYTWKSIAFAFFGGAISVGALFLDQYIVGYNLNSGWIQIFWLQPLIYVFVYSYIFLIAVIIFGGHLVKAYRKNRGKDKQTLKRIIIIYFVSIAGIFVFNSLRSLRLIDYPYINSLDAIFIALGFGYLSWQYLKQPHLFHLDLLDVQLYGLFVYDNDGPLLYSYEFQVKGFKNKEEMITAALAGVDSLFKEILQSDQPLKEVKQESNVVLFERGKTITVGLVCNLSTLMTRNWLYQFRAEFEKEFKKELEEYTKSKFVGFGDKPDKLAKKIFLH
ncbi:MAG: hypothetical protein ACETWM_12835 [Candidatus Lokiarchaeia archaeon]